MPLLNPFDFVLFGGTGDLAMRKLIPALYQRFVDGQFDEQARILACASTGLSRADYIQRAAGQCREHLAAAGFREIAVLDGAATATPAAAA